MKAVHFLLIVSISLVLIGCSSQTEASQNDNHMEPVNPLSETKRAVLVELFTSEGCSSCPPADRALAFLENEQPVNSAEIIGLAFHVDYWNSSSWKDEFSSPLFTSRQNQYAEGLKVDAVYTPQMVVDGQAEFVGSDLGKATNAIGKSTGSAKGQINAAIESGSIRITVSNLPKHEQATIYLATAEDNIESRVGGGENLGETFHHMSVVRELRPLGLIAADMDNFETESILPLQPQWKKHNVKYVVFVQENASRKIVAAGRIAK
jgi:hypothetical protein